MTPLRSSLLLATLLTLTGCQSSASAQSPLEDLSAWLATDPDARPTLTQQAFADHALTEAEAKKATKLLLAAHRERIRRERAAEMKARVITRGDHRMPFFYRVFGEAPESGRALYISRHGGGGTAARVNDQQWENQKRLYRPDEGVYLAPRAPTNAWNLWHQDHIDPMFRRLIENLIVFDNVDPDRVYLLGYSAGGDGVYQLAPRMADSFAGASMMAGHPNETSPLGLRNLPFSIHVGERDSGYNRNKVARQWQQKLADLAEKDPHGYEHWGKIYEGKGHWMDREDAAALPWMAKYRRRRHPERVVWKQD
ncbi:MAG: hypothetical protein R3336_03840, partial [Phycisphaeraceae bacterium]|nr:hypothetical protein [Phycisphaeraceae bacterium]